MPRIGEIPKPRSVGAFKIFSAHIREIFPQQPAVRPFYQAAMLSLSCHGQIVFCS